SAYAPDKAATIVPFAPAPKAQPEAAVDESGRAIVAMLQRAADMAKEDCARAMDLAHKLSFQLRAAEERARDADAEAAHLRGRARRRHGGGAPLAEQTLARHVVLIVGAQSLCSGVAIAPDLVLTAAHCVLDNGKYRLVTFEGRRASVREVAAVASHPQFSARADAPDIALVKLATTPAPNLVPAALSERRAPPAVGDRFIVAGFCVAGPGDRKTAGKLRAVT